MTIVSARVEPVFADSLTDQLHRIAGARRATPLRQVRGTIGGQARTLSLKWEADNCWGSVKERTALGLLESVADRLTLPGASLVESTSGNLGVALAAAAERLGIPFVAVVDPNLSPVLADRIRAHGAELDVVARPDDQGGFLGARLARVAERMAADPGAVWTDQYHNPANPGVHERSTGPELLAQTRGEVDVVFAAISTGGTLAGVARHLRRHHRSVRIVAVDVPGSRVLREPRGRRILTGIGASRPSPFLRPDLIDDVVIVEDAAAIATCHIMRRDAGIGLGGSSGAVVHAALTYLARHPHLRTPVCICPDDDAGYLPTLYDRQWLAATHGLDLSIDEGPAARAGFFEITGRRG